MTILSSLDNEQTRNHQLSKIMNIEIDDIESNELNTAPLNYLDELEILIRQNGIIEPIVVYKVANHHYRLLAGERRYTIAKRLKYETLPALIVEPPQDPIDEEMLIKLHNVQRPDDEETLREKIIGFKQLCERKRQRGDEDVRGLRTTEWISQQLGGLSARTIQEYLTGRYSENYVEDLKSEMDSNEESKTSENQKKKSLKSITKMMAKLHKDLEDFDLMKLDYGRKDLIDFEYECSELFIHLSRNGSVIKKAKEALDENVMSVESLKVTEEQLTIDYE